MSDFIATADASKPNEAWREVLRILSGRHKVTHAEKIASELTPLEASVLRDCVKRGSTRTNDGGLVDTLLSGLCSKPSLNNPIMHWRSNPDYRLDGYVSKYEPSNLGREVAAAIPEPK